MSALPNLEVLAIEAGGERQSDPRGPRISFDDESLWELYRLIAAHIEGSADVQRIMDGSRE